MIEMSRSVEDYLAALYRLVSEKGVARTQDLARALGVAPATVTKVMSRLAERGLVVWEPYRGFRLTRRGLEIARRVVWRHRVCERFLSDVLGIDPSRVHGYAHLMEHLPDEIVERMDQLLGRPRSCPHGKPIPRDDEFFGDVSGDEAVTH